MRRIFEGKENEYYARIDAKGNKSIIRMKKLSPEIVKEDNDLLLTRFHNTNVDTTIIMNENINYTQRDILKKFKKPSMKNKVI